MQELTVQEKAQTNSIYMKHKC